MGLLCLASGTSVITENVHTDRYIHAAELNRMGAKIMLDGTKAIINGVSKLSGAPCDGFRSPRGCCPSLRLEWQRRAKLLYRASITSIADMNQSREN